MSQSKQLKGRLLDIATGRAGLSLAKVHAYRDLFTKQGFALPPLDESAVPSLHYQTTVSTVRPRVVEAEAERRIAICESNRCGAFVVGQCTHGSCGSCLRTIEKKALWVDQSCPLGLWESRHPISRHVTRFAVGITAAPRPTPTVHQCVQSVIAAGFEPTVFAEPHTPTAALSCRVVSRPRRLGCFHNYLQTLEDLLASDPEAQAIVVFQDDVIVSKDLRPFLEHDLWPSDKCGAVSLYSPDFYGYEHGRPPGFFRQPGKFLMGACGMVYPRHVAQALTTRHREWRGAAKGVITDPVKKKAVDTWIGHAVKGENLHVYYPNPSLCQHIAETSSIGHGGNSQLRKGKTYRKSGRFAGTEVSAFALWEPPAVRFNTDGTMRLREPLSVVIPAWNCFDLTSKCLTALATNAGVSPLDVIYVDNGSDPGVVDQVKQLAQQLQLPLRTIEFPENRGFCPAANAGMQAAAGHVLLLNNDAYIHKGCLPAMLRHLWADSKVASVGPLTGDSGSQSVAKHAKLAKLRGQRKTLDRTMLVGFCQLKRKEALAAIGYLDDNLPHGLGTDDDWAHRARAAGWKLLLACDAYADHDHKSTFRRSGQDRAAMQKEAVRYLKDKGTW